MLDVQDPLTHSLALVLGAYLLLSATGILTRADAASGMIADLRDAPAVAHVVGALAFFVGTGLLVLHPRWSSLPEALVSAVAAWWMIEGALILTFGPRLLARPDAALHFRRMTWVAVPIGLVLIAIGAAPFLETLK